MTVKGDRETKKQVSLRNEKLKTLSKPETTYANKSSKKFCIFLGETFNEISLKYVKHSVKVSDFK